MADTAFTVKVGEKQYVLDKITLGDWRVLKTEFDLDTNDILLSFTNDDGDDVSIFNVGNANVLVGLMVIALRHQRPNASIASLVAEVEQHDMSDIEFASDSGEDEEAEADPTEAGADASEETDKPAKSGSSAKPRKKPGSPR